MAHRENRDFVRVGRSGIQGQGLYARRRIPRGTRIIEYTGDRVPLARLLVEVSGGAAAQVFTFRVNGSTVIDGARGGNEARLINHSCDPNCDAYVFDERVYIYARRDIERGEELTFDYQLRPALDRRPPKHDTAAYRCGCGAPRCRGTMLAGRRLAKRMSSATALAASLLAGSLMAIPASAGAHRGRGTDSSVAAAQGPQPGNPRLKFASVYVKLSERFAIVGLDTSHPVYRNAKGEYFYLDPSTGDMKFLSPDLYNKFSSTVRVAKGIPVKALKLDGSKYGGPVRLMGIDAQGNVVQKNPRGELFYLNPTNGDMVLVK